MDEIIKFIENDFKKESFNEIQLVRNISFYILENDYKKITKSIIFDLFYGIGTITGSYALLSYQLINRIPNDIDILCDTTNGKIKYLIKKYGIKEYTKFDNEDYGMSSNRLYKLSISNVNIDLFHSINHNYNEINGYRIHYPLKALNEKLILYKKIKRSKDKLDLEFAYNKLL